MANIVPVLQMLGLPIASTPEDAVEAIRKLQWEINQFRKSAENWSQAYHNECKGHAATRKTLDQAANPENWCAVFTGDPSSQDPDTTSITHGNLVTLEGTGQVLMHYRPVTKNVRRSPKN